MFHKISEENMPDVKNMVVLIAKDINVGSSYYTTDPYVGWRNSDGTWARWPHNFEPTHFSFIDYEGL